MSNEQRWQEAFEYVKELKGAYIKLPMGTGAFGALRMSVALDLYEAGDRSDALLMLMESFE